MLRASEIAAAREVGSDLGSEELVQRDAMPAGRSKRATGAMWDLERALPFPPSRLHGREGRIEVGHPVDQDGMVALEVIGQQGEGWTVGELDRGSPRSSR